MELAREVLCTVRMCVTLGALTLLSRPHSDLINVVQVDTMAALFYRVALCALAVFSLEVKGRPLA